MPFRLGRQRAKQIFKMAAMMFDFRSELFSLIMIYKLPRYLLLSFLSIGLSVQERSAKYIFKVADMTAIGFPIQRFYLVLDLQVTKMVYQISSQLALGCRRIRLLKQIVDAARRTTHDGRRTTHDGRQTLTDHNSSPWILRAQVS